MNKDKVEAIFRKAGLMPAAREKVREYNVFVADGFSLPPHHKLSRFGVDPEDFPKGCYITFWWAGKDESLHAGRPLFFDALHNNDYDLTTKRQARLSAALKDADGHIQAWQRNRLNG